MFVDDLFNKKTLTESNGGGSPWHSEPEQQQMDADRRGRLGRERNAGLDEPDDTASGSAPTGNGVYEYTVPAGQESTAQELGLQQHRGRWVSRVPIQRANFQFGRPQFHEIPSKGVAEGSAEAPVKHHTVLVSYHKKDDPHRRYEARFKTTHNLGKEETEKRAKAAFAAKGKVVYNIVHEQGVAEGVRDLGYDAQSLIMKLRRDVEEKRLQPTRQAVLSAARELAGDMDFAPELLVRQVLGQGVAEGLMSKKQLQAQQAQINHLIRQGYELDPKDNKWRKPKNNNTEPKKKEQGVAEAATPASTSKILRLIQRHHSDWFDTYGIGEVEDAVVDMAEMGQFQGMSAEDAVALVAQELDSLYGAQGMAEGSSFPGAFSNRDVESIRKLQRSNRDQSSTPTAPHQRSDWFDPASSVGAKKQKLAYLKSKKQQGVAEGMLDNPGEQDSPVAQAIVRRILLQRTDLLAKYGPEKVGAAVDEVADFVGDVEEIGSSDVSGWIRHVEQMLGNMEQGVEEGAQVNEVFNIVPNLAQQIEKKENELKALKAKMAARTTTNAGIQTGATALIDPDTDRPYEKDKLAAMYGYKEPEAAADDAQADETPPAPVAQTPAQIRAAKQKAAAATAQGQMAGAAPAPVAQTPAATTATNPVGFNASNVMKLPGMEKYAKPAAPAKTANFAGPGGYGKTTTSIKPPAAPSSPALAVPKAPAVPKVTSGGPTPAEKAALDKRIAAAAAAAPAVAETLAQVERMLESVNSKKSADMIRAYVDQRFTELGLRNTQECRNLMTHVVQESAIRRRQYAKSLAN